MVSISFLLTTVDSFALGFQNACSNAQVQIVNNTGNTLYYWVDQENGNLTGPSMGSASSPVAITSGVPPVTFQASDSFTSGTIYFKTDSSSSDYPASVFYYFSSKLITGNNACDANQSKVNPGGGIVFSYTQPPSGNHTETFYVSVS